MTCKSLGSYTIKVKAGTPALVTSSDGYPVSYNNMHGPAAARTHDYAIVATRRNGGSLVTPPSTADIIAYGGMPSQEYYLANQPPLIQGAGFFDGQNWIGSFYSAPVYEIVGFTMPNTGMTIFDGLSFGYPQSDLYTIGQCCGWNGDAANFGAFFSIETTFNFILANQFGSIIIDSLFRPNVDQSFAILGFGAPQFAQALIYYTSGVTTGMYSTLLANGVLNPFTFDDATLNGYVSNQSNFINLAACGVGYALTLDVSGAAVFILISADLSKYIVLNFDLSEVIAQGYADALGINFYIDDMGTIFVGTDIDTVQIGANYYYVPLYASLLSAIPPPYNLSFARRAGLSPHCCPTGDGHR